MKIHGKNLPGRRSRECKGLEAGVCLACLRNSGESSVAGEQSEQEEWLEMK